MNILILGGTGAMGKELTKIISNNATKVVVTSRNKKGKNGNIEFITGNAKSIDFLNSILDKNWDVIIDFMVYKTKEFEDRYTRLLNATNHYVFLSSSRVYADSTEPLTEDSPRLLDVVKDDAYIQSDEYALSKAHQENILFKCNRKNWTIIRPYITYNTERLQLGVLEKEYWLYSALNGRSITFSKEMYNKYTTLTHGRDVAKGISSLINNPRAFGEAFHITSDMHLTWGQITNIYLDTLESYLKYRPNLVLHDLDTFMQWRGERYRYQVVYDRLYNRRFNTHKINEFIDTSNFTSAYDGLTECLENFIISKDTRFQDINWKAEAIKNKFNNENSLLKEFPNCKQAIKYYLYRYSKILN